jgi:hypothetical protein
VNWFTIVLILFAPVQRPSLTASCGNARVSQRRPDNAEKHEPNHIHPEDYGMCAAYDQPIAASTKRYLHVTGDRATPNSNHIPDATILTHRHQ